MCAQTFAAPRVNGQKWRTDVVPMAEVTCMYRPDCGRIGIVSVLPCVNAAVISAQCSLNVQMPVLVVTE